MAEGKPKFDQINTG